MNCNFYWQSAPISLVPTPSTCFYIGQGSLNQQNQIDYESKFKEIKKKCKELELENSTLKEEISILERIKHRKGKRIIRRRRQEELDKKFKCQHFNCKKQYASALALNLHMRNKHSEDTQRKSTDKKRITSDDQNIIKQQGEYSNTRY